MCHGSGVEVCNRQPHINLRSSLPSAADQGRLQPARPARLRVMARICGMPMRGEFSLGPFYLRVARNVSRAFRREMVSSRPRSTIISKRPGLTVRPVNATRTAWIRLPGLMPRSAAAARTVISTCGSSNGLVAASAAVSAPRWPAVSAEAKCFSRAASSYVTDEARSGLACSTKSVSRLARGRNNSSSR